MLKSLFQGMLISSPTLQVQVANAFFFAVFVNVCIFKPTRSLVRRYSESRPWLEATIDVKQIHRRKRTLVGA